MWRSGTEYKVKLAGLWRVQLRSTAHTTNLGQQVLAEMNAHWDRLNDNVQHIRKGTHR